MLLIGVSIVGLIHDLILEDQLPPAQTEMAVIGAFCIPIPSVILLALEWYALRRRSCVATALLGFGFAFFVVCGLVSLVRGILGLVGLLSLDNEWRSWSDVIFFAGYLGALAVVAVGHILWFRTLRKALSTSESSSCAR